MIHGEYGRLVSMVQFQGMVLIATEFGMIYQLVIPGDDSSRAYVQEFLKIS